MHVGKVKYEKEHTDSKLEEGDLNVYKYMGFLNSCKGINCISLHIFIFKLKKQHVFF